MAKVVLNNGLNVDALVLVKANLRQFMDESRKLVEKAEKSGDIEHRFDLVRLRNMIYFLSLDLQNLPVRKYKQKQN